MSELWDAYVAGSRPSRGKTDFLMELCALVSSAPVSHRSGLRSKQDRLIAELRTHPVAEDELRELKEGVVISLSQSQPGFIEYAFWLSVPLDQRAFFSKTAEHST